MMSRQPENVLSNHATVRFEAGEAVAEMPNRDDYMAAVVYSTGVPNEVRGGDQAIGTVLSPGVESGGGRSDATRLVMRTIRTVKTST